MVKEFNDKITKDNIVASPRDEVVTGTITKIERGLLSEFVDPKHHTSFDNLEQEYLNIHFEVNFNGKLIKASDKLAYYAEPMSNSSLAKFLVKYDELKSGQEIKVLYDDKGFGKIKIV